MESPQIPRPALTVRANIWSHLLGTLLFLVYLLRFTTTSYPTPETPITADVLAVSVYYLAVVNCFALSTSYHTFSNHSKAVHNFGNSLDHLGIILVIHGSTVPATYFQYYCDPFTRNVYWTISTAFALACTILTVRQKFRTPEYRKPRFYMYTLLGLSCFIPVTRGILTMATRSSIETCQLVISSDLASFNSQGLPYTQRGCLSDLCRRHWTY